MTAPKDLDYTGHRLRWIGSRVIDAQHHIHEIEPRPHRHHPHHQKHNHNNHDGHGHIHGHADDELSLLKRTGFDPMDTPIFRRNHSATHFELFYDLFFVANLSVFGSLHDISNEKALLSFIGYITLLWTTWAMTTVFDVRYTADSVLERCCRAVHLGVMVGFAEIGTSFNPDAQIKSVFQAMSLFLGVSRLVLGIQYACVAWQVRKYVDGWRPLGVTAMFHWAAMAVYVGIAFRYQEGKNSRVYIVWYLVGVAELGLHLAFSQLSEVLTFVGTHLGERMNLLTLIIVGEGAILLAKNVTLLVKDTFLKDSKINIWSPSLIGIVTASTALIYLIFQLYFDWLHEDEDGLTVRHQVWWTGIHTPFHVALVLFLEGANQFIIWARIQESVNKAVTILLDLINESFENITSAVVADKISATTFAFLKKYPPADVMGTYNDLNRTISHIRDIPQDYWDEQVKFDDYDDVTEHLANDLQEIASTMVNAIYYSFGIEGEDMKVLSGHGGLTSEEAEQEYGQTEANMAIKKRFLLVFIYAFACAGIVLLILTIMHVISKRRGWTPFNIGRTIVCFGIAIGLSLVATMATNKIAANNFVGSSWMLPTITICYFTVLVLTHLPHPTLWGLGKFKNGTYAEVRSAKTDAKQGLPLRDMPPYDQGFDDRRTAAGYTMADVDLEDNSPPPSAGIINLRNEKRHTRTVSFNANEPSENHPVPPRTASYMSHLSDDFADPMGSPPIIPRRVSHMDQMSTDSNDLTRSSPIYSFDQSERYHNMAQEQGRIYDP